MPSTTTTTTTTTRMRSDMPPSPAKLRVTQRQSSMPRLRDLIPMGRASGESYGSTASSSSLSSSSSSSSRDLRRLGSSLDLAPGSLPIRGEPELRSQASVNTRWKGVRPLPPIPTTIPPCYTEFCDHPSLRVVRPLPSPPTRSSTPVSVGSGTSTGRSSRRDADVIDIRITPSPVLHQNVVATTTTTPPSRLTPAKPTTSAEGSPNALTLASAPSVRLVPSPNINTRSALPLLVTDPELLRPPVHTATDTNTDTDPEAEAEAEEFELLSASESLATPEPLTPLTAKRKRVSKLRRHLGEGVPEDAVPVIHVKTPPPPPAVAALAPQPAFDVTPDPTPKSAPGTSKQKTVHRLGVDSIYLRAAITVGKILSMSDDGGSDRSSVASGDGEGGEVYEWDFVERRECRSMNRRESRKWVREKGGKRWEEPDYENVLRALRAL